MLNQLLSIRELDRESLLLILENADKFCEISERRLKKVPALRGKSVINLFLEPSTRTRTSFEIAGKRLSADTINISGSSSSVSKGESLLDTAKTIEAMRPDILVVRHNAAGAAHFLQKALPHIAVVNAGDGMHEHPTQALLDCLTIKQHFETSGRKTEQLTIGIIGDILHSRVARSNVWAHLKLGNEVRLIGPPTLVPKEFKSIGTEGPGSVEVFHNRDKGLEGCDVVMALRIQRERQAGLYLSSLEEYYREFGISKGVLDRCAPDAALMHPGPVNRGVEISSELVYSDRSLIQQQVENGVAVRMAVLYLLSAARGESFIEMAES